MNRVIEQLEAEQLRQDLPDIEIGDTVRVHLRITEGEGKDRRTRIQVFEGVVIGRKGRAVNDMLTVRRVTYGIGVERTFPVHSPNIEKFEITRKGDVRRAKLYYLRDRVGKSARVKERARWAGRKPKPVEAEAPEPVAEPEVKPKTRGKAKAKAVAEPVAAVEEPKVESVAEAVEPEESGEA